MDPALSLQQLELLLWYGFDPWPGNFHMLMNKVPPGGKKNCNDNRTTEGSISEGCK